MTPVVLHILGRPLGVPGLRTWMGKGPGVCYPGKVWQQAELRAGHLRQVGRSREA